MAIEDRINEILAVNALGRDLIEGVEDLFNPAPPPAASSSSIEAFKSYFSMAGDFSRTDLFNVQILVPPELTMAFGLAADNLILQCEAAELPGKSIDTLAIRHNLFVDRVPIDVLFPEVTLQFICRSDLLEKKLFDAWMNTMVNTNEDDWRYGLVKYKRGRPGDDEQINPYDTIVTIFQKFHVPTALNASAIRLIDAFPIQVASMPLNWQDTSFHKLSVTFAYRRWEDATVSYTEPQRKAKVSVEDVVDRFGNFSNLPTEVDEQEFQGKKEISSVVSWKDVEGSIPRIRDWKTILGVGEFDER